MHLIRELTSVRRVSDVAKKKGKPRGTYIKGGKSSNRPSAEKREEARRKGILTKRDEKDIQKGRL